jgi:DNA-binding Lrp family transcriptional regulator
VRSESSTKQISGSPLQTHNAKGVGLYDDVGHDAFASGGLDKIGFRIVRHLAGCPGWHTQSELARSLGVAPGTVCRRVQAAKEGPYGVSLNRRRALVTSGLVERNEKGALRLRPGVRPEDLDAVAEYFGTLGARDEHRVALRGRYQLMGWLSEDCHWIDPTTDEPGTVATWLLPSSLIEGELRLTI